MIDVPRIIFLCGGPYDGRVWETPSGSRLELPSVSIYPVLGPMRHTERYSPNGEWDVLRVLVWTYDGPDRFPWTEANAHTLSG